jgi:hypothetical protein
MFIDKTMNLRPALQRSAMSPAKVRDDVARKVDKSTREAVSEPGAVATGSAWRKDFIEKTGVR